MVYFWVNSLEILDNSSSFNNISIIWSPIWKWRKTPNWSILPYLPVLGKVLDSEVLSCSPSDLRFFYISVEIGFIKLQRMSISDYSNFVSIILKFSGQLAENPQSQPHWKLKNFVDLLSSSTVDSFFDLDLTNTYWCQGLKSFIVEHIPIKCKFQSMQQVSSARPSSSRANENFGWATSTLILWKEGWEAGRNMMKVIEKPNNEKFKLNVSKELRSTIFIIIKNHLFKWLKCQT